MFFPGAGKQDTLSFYSEVLVLVYIRGHGRGSTESPIGTCVALPTKKRSFAKSPDNEDTGITLAAVFSS